MAEVRFYNGDGSMHEEAQNALPVKVEIDGDGIIASLSAQNARDVAEFILIRLAGGSRARAAAALAMHPMREPQKPST